jgi:hypothetical protein
MPRFHLNIFDGDKLIVDDEGSPLPDLDAAQREAVAAAREMWAAAIVAGDDLAGYRFEIAAPDGATLHALTFDEVLPERLSRALRTS